MKLQRRADAGGGYLLFGYTPQYPETAAEAVHKTEAAAGTAQQQLLPRHPNPRGSQRHSQQPAADAAAATCRTLSPGPPLPSGCFPAPESSKPKGSSPLQQTPQTPLASPQLRTHPHCCCCCCCCCARWNTWESSHAPNSHAQTRCCCRRCCCCRGWCYCWRCCCSSCYCCFLLAPPKVHRVCKRQGEHHSSSQDCRYCLEVAFCSKEGGRICLLQLQRCRLKEERRLQD